MKNEKMGKQLQQATLWPIKYHSGEPHMRTWSICANQLSDCTLKTFQKTMELEFCSLRTVDVCSSRHLARSTPTMPKEEVLIVKGDCICIRGLFVPCFNPAGR